MQWIKHSKIFEGAHAFLSASKYAWLRYSDDKLMEVYRKHRAAARGTELHELAARLINAGVKLPKNGSTLSMYVNDAIGYRMTTEQLLFYSENCFGTADAISFRNNTLRIHDFKSGESPAKMDQLMIYASIFCLEYDVNPKDIRIELRIYQSNDVEKYCPPAEEISDIMDIIKHANDIINEIRKMEED